LKPDASSINYAMLKSSNSNIHWVLCASASNGEGHRALYVKVFGRISSSSPIWVTFAIDDKSGIKHQTINLEAVSAASSFQDVLESGDFWVVHDKQLARWNGGKEVNEKGLLKNIKIKVTLSS
jgi:hypothetical protein